MENDLRDRAERMARKLRACADDEQCAACAEECGVNDGTLLLAAAQTIRDLLEGAGGEERTEGETETPSWIKAAYEAGPENYDTVLDRGLSAIGREVMDIANRHKKDLPLVIAVLRLTIAPLERHMTDEGQAMLQWILRNAAAVDLTDAQKLKKGPGGAATPSGQSDEGQMTTKYTPMITDGGEKGKEKFYDGSAEGGNRGH